MLRRVLLTLAVVLAPLAIVIASSTPAFACKRTVGPDGQIILDCSSSGGGGGGGGGSTPIGGGGGGSSSGSDPVGSGEPDVCRSPGGTVIPCTVPGSPWNGSCYLGNRLQPQPPPPPGQTRQDGAWYSCVQYADAQIPVDNAPQWVENGEAAGGGPAPVLIDPIVLAYRAIAAMDLDPINMGIVPESGDDRLGLVGLPTWMWVEDQTPSTWGPITRSAAEGPVAVTATAQAEQVVWDMGDGTTKVCGEGTPYVDSYGTSDSPSCGHRYASTSIDQPDRAYQVTATTEWVVEWEGFGQSGTIELELTSDPLPVRVGEMQVLVQ